VDARSQICNIGRTGWTSWPHVHLVIKKDGVHQKLSNFFDARLVHYCHFTKCQATNDPKALVSFGNTTWVGQTVTSVQQTFDSRLAGVVFLVCFLLFLMGNKYIRYGLFFLISAYAAIVTAMPAQTVMASTPMVSSGSGLGAGLPNCAE